jgi:hypothetical protein
LSGAQHSDCADRIRLFSARCVSCLAPPLPRPHHTAPLRAVPGAPSKINTIRPEAFPAGNVDERSMSVELPPPCAVRPGEHVSGARCFIRD